MTTTSRKGQKTVSIALWNNQMFAGARAEAIRFWSERSSTKFLALRDELMARMAARFTNISEQADLILDTLKKCFQNDREVLMMTVLAFYGTLEGVEDHELSGRPIAQDVYDFFLKNCQVDLGQLEKSKLNLFDTTHRICDYLFTNLDTQKSLEQEQVAFVTWILKSKLTPFRSDLGFKRQTELTDEEGIALTHRVRPLMQEIELQFSNRSSVYDDNRMIIGLISALSSSDERAILFGGIIRSSLEAMSSPIAIINFCPGHASEPEKMKTSSGQRRRRPATKKSAE